jgi:hypothetical protein
MNVLKELDSATTKLVEAVFASVPMTNWKNLECRIRVVPDGSVLRRQVTFFLGLGVIDRSSDLLSLPGRDLTTLALDHWKLTQNLGQSRWYMMTIKLERSGKYTVDFEYRDDYKEGDIMQPLP